MRKRDAGNPDRQAAADKSNKKNIQISSGWVKKKQTDTEFSHFLQLTSNWQ